MTYTNTLNLNIAGTEKGMIEKITQDVMIYIDGEPDYVGPDFVIKANDTKGIAIFREFAVKMAAHYKSLNPTQ